jgi:hypothetical protein
MFINLWALMVAAWADGGKTWPLDLYSRAVEHYNARRDSHLKRDRITAHPLAMGKTGNRFHPTH